MGEIPSGGTRGAGCMVEEGGECYHGGDDIGGEFPLLSQRCGSHPAPSSTSQQPTANPNSAEAMTLIRSKNSPPFQAQIDRFVGYFRSKQHPKPQTYAEACRLDPIRTMVNPIGNRGGGRTDGFGAGRHGRGAGRTGGGLFVWQRSGEGRAQREWRSVG